MKCGHWLFAVLVLTLGNPSFAQYADWKHSGSLFILTTPEGADLPASASLENFPLLVRLKNNGHRHDHLLPALQKLVPPKPPPRPGLPRRIDVF